MAAKTCRVFECESKTGRHSARALQLFIHALKICDRLLEACVQRNRRRPAQQRSRARNIRLPLPGIVRRKRLELDSRTRSRHRDDLVREVSHREFDGISEVDWSNYFVAALHQAD